MISFFLTVFKNVSNISFRHFLDVFKKSWCPPEICWHRMS